MGIYEILTYGIGYNLNCNNALFLKSNTLTLGDGYFGDGYGIKYTYSFDSSYIFKNVSFCVSGITKITDTDVNKIHKQKIKGWAFEISTEREKVYNKFIVIQYEFGVITTRYITKNIRVWPTLRIGFTLSL